MTFVSLSAPEVEPDREVDPGALQLQRDLCEFLRLKIKLFLLITGGPLDGAGTSPWQAVPLRPAFPVLRIDEWRPGKRDIETAKQRWLLSCATCCSARLSIPSKLAIVSFRRLAERPVSGRCRNAIPFHVLRIRRFVGSARSTHVRYSRAGIRFSRDLSKGSSGRAAGQATLQCDNSLLSARLRLRQRRCTKRQTGKV